jgi:hypothetical protein
MLRLVNEILLIHPEEAGTGLFAVAAIGFVDGYGWQLSDHPLLWSTTFPDPARAPEGKGGSAPSCTRGAECPAAAAQRRSRCWLTPRSACRPRPQLGPETQPLWPGACSATHQLISAPRLASALSASLEPPSIFERSKHAPLGANMGANGHHFQATSSHSHFPSTQLEGSHGHTRRRLTMVRRCLLISGSWVRILPGALCRAHFVLGLGPITPRPSQRSTQP